MAEVVLSAKELAEFKAEFDKYDTSGDGLLDIEEVVVMLKDMGFPSMSRATIERRFKFYDTDGDSTLTFKEFHEEFLNTRARAEFEEAIIRRMFMNAATDASLRITPDQVDVDQLSDLRMGDDFLGKTLSKAKETGDGKIDVEEFYAAYLENLATLDK